MDIEKASLLGKMGAAAGGRVLLVVYRSKEEKVRA